MEILKIKENLVICTPDKWNELTIEKLLKDYWRAPKKLSHEWRMSKKVTVNGELANWTSPLHVGDTLSLPVFEETELQSVSPTNLNITVLYEDDHLLIVNKPAGMDTHPSSDGQTNTLQNGVAYHLQNTGQTCVARHIHRLDKDTTGAILFAKNHFVAALLDKQLEERKITRTYVAIVEGIVKKDFGTIRANIGRDRHHATRRRVSPSGQPAITHYKVLKRFLDKSLTLVSCQLDTGRTHQIRVHFSHIQHPLAGDILYGGNRSFPRQALHARKIEFLHPLTEKKIVCEAPYLDKPAIFPEFPSI